MGKFFLENGSEQSSMMRFLAFITVMTGLIIALIIVIYGMVEGNEGINIVRELIYLCFGVIGFGFSGKLVQKYAENKNKEK